MSTIHVANLSPAIHGDMLRSIFAHFGPIADIRLISGQGPASYAFVEFSTSDAAVKALAMSGSEFDGRALRVELANQKGGGGAVPPANPQALSAELFVGGLAPSITGDMLRMHFSRWGAVQEANVMTHRQTGVSKGFRVCEIAVPRPGFGLCRWRSTHHRGPDAERRAVQFRQERGWHASPRRRRGSGNTALIMKETVGGCASSSCSMPRPPSKPTHRKSRRTRMRRVAHSVSIRSIGVPRPKVSGLAVWVEFDESRAARAAAASLASRTYGTGGRSASASFRVMRRGAARRRPRRRPMGILSASEKKHASRPTKVACCSAASRTSNLN